MKRNVIIAFILLFLLKLFLSILDYYGNSSPELHSEILKYFTLEDISNGEAYVRRGFGIAIARIIIFTVILMVMSFTSLSVKLEKFCDELTKQRFFLTTICFIAVLYSLAALISFPFNFYFSYILEHRFGFSNMTLGFWFWTWFKNFLLVVCSVSIIGALALAVIRKFRVYSAFIVPLGALIIALAMLIIYPTVILPIFYDIKPIENPLLEKRIVELGDKTGVSVDKIYVIKESEYSNHTNAFFVGFGDHKKIYLYDTLIKNNSEGELISILAHEIGHWAYNHNMKGVVTGFLMSLFGFWIIFYVVKKMQAESENTIGEMHSPSMIPLYLLLFIIITNITNPIEMAVSRKMEKQADYYALETTGDPDAFISSEIRIAKDNRSRLNRHPIPAFFRSSHPSAIERIKMGIEYKESVIHGR
ncbi:MAG: peptidase [Spirochaetae bacterium HGW-Spirochaetae-5]|nr:MAG: peptidase [Spirochaetae bacterium HGW-Spirochaetae-5]